MTLFALSLGSFLLSASLAYSQPAQEFNLGDRAPALQISEWLKGEALPALDNGDIHVIVFWGTW